MSLRARVLLGLAAIAVVLVVAASVIVRTTETYLVAQVDDRLRSVEVPYRDFDFADGGPSLPPPGDLDDQPQRLSPLYTGIVMDDGTVETVFAPNLADATVSLPAIAADQAIAAASTGEAFTVESTDGASRYRARAIVDPRRGTVIVSALPLEDTDAAVRRLVAVELGVTVLALGALALVGWWVIRLGIRPVDDMTEAAEAIAAGDLSHRVPESDPRTEAGKLGLALNQMLGRIEETFDDRARTDERLRQFVADASHELRTPVTTIRGYAELYRVGALAEPDALDEAMRRTEEEAIRMGALVEDMLQLARLDQGRPLEKAPVDLGVIARDAAADARAVRPDRPITAVVAGLGAGPAARPVPVADAGATTSGRSDPPGASGTTAAPSDASRLPREADGAGAEAGVVPGDAVVVLGDSDRLRQVVANLVGNALVHTPDDAAIEIRVEPRGREAVIEVVDHGPGMAPEVAERAFERFFRADPARSRHRGGSGLGLAIVQAVVAAHGGRIELSSRVGEGTTVRVILPVAGATPVDPLGPPTPPS